MTHVDLDPQPDVNDYRGIMTQLESATTPETKAKFEGMAKRARDRWKTWQGEDSLHEMAFGD